MARSKRASSKSSKRVGLIKKSVAQATKDNRVSKKKVAITKKQVAKLGREITKNFKASISKKSNGQSRATKSSKSQSSKTGDRNRKASSKVSRDIGKKIATVLRDAFGRFAKATPPSKPQQKARSKSKTPTRPNTRSKPTQPKKSAVKSKQSRTKSVAAKSLQKKISSSTPPSKKSTPAKPAKQQKKLTLKSALPRRGEKLTAYFDRVEDHEEEYDALKDEDDFWAFSYGKGRSKRLWETMGQAVQQMRSYKLSQAIEENDEDSDEYEQDIENELLRSISFEKIPGGKGVARGYADMRETEIKARKADRKRIYRQGKKLLADAGAPVAGFGSGTDIIAGLIAQNEALKSQLGVSNETKRSSKAGGSKQAAGTKKASSVKR